VRSEREHGRHVPVRIEESVDQVQVAGPAAPRTHRELARELRVGGSGERRRFLVPHVDPVDATALPDGVCYGVQAVADDPVDAPDPGLGERFHEPFGYGVCDHLVPPKSAPAEPSRQSRRTTRERGGTRMNAGAVVLAIVNRTEQMACLNRRAQPLRPARLPWQPVFTDRLACRHAGSAAARHSRRRIVPGCLTGSS